MRKTLLVVLAGLTSMACSGSETDTTGTLEIVNGTSETIDEVYVARSGAASWGASRNLSAMAPDTMLTLSGIDSALWSVRAVVNADSTYYAYVDEVPVAVGQTTAVDLYDSDFSGTISVWNDDGYLTLADVWVSPRGQNDWSEDLLAGTLGVDEYVEVVDLPPGQYDVQCRFTDDTYVYDVVTVSSLSIVDSYCYVY